MLRRDGLSGSNSYNFIRHGFDGVLVEPFPDHQQRLLSNLEPYMNTGRQSVQLVRGVVSDKDGTLGLTIYDTENSKTSNTVLDVSDNPEYWYVPCTTSVATDVQCDTSSVLYLYCIVSFAGRSTIVAATQTRRAS